MNGQKKIKILSYNVQQIPNKAIRSLAEGLVDNLSNNEDFRYDVVCLQEVFWDPHRRIIAKGLKRGGYEYQVKKSGSEISDWIPFFGWFNQDSGLFFASRYSIVKRRRKFEKFEAPGEEFDFVARKGVFYTEVNIDGKKLFVFNTHLQSGEHPSLRKLQLDQIKTCINREICNMINIHDLPTNEEGNEYIGDFGIILTGDLNIDENERKEEYEYMRDEIFNDGRDIYRVHYPDDPGYTHEGRINRRLDYIFDFNYITIPEDKIADNGIGKIKIKELDVCEAEVVKMKTAGRDISDHYGVGITVKI